MPLRGSGFYQRRDLGDPSGNGDIFLKGTTLSLNEDLVCGNLRIKSGQILSNSYWIFASGTVFMEGVLGNPAVISNDGGGGGFGTSVGAGEPVGSLGGGGNGGAGSTSTALSQGQPFAGASISAIGFLAGGGAGGDSSPSSSGQSFGGQAQFPGGVYGSFYRPNVFDFGVVFGSSNNTLKICGGAGGGAGAGQGGKRGGAGGGGGGVIAIVCREFVMDGYAIVEAGGGAGGNAETSGGAGGGGGGGGGGIMIICDQVRILNSSANCKLWAPGGVGGAGGGTGQTGITGDPGLVHIISQRGHLTLPGNGTVNGSNANYRTIPSFAYSP